MEKVIVPNSVRRLGSSAFSSCSHLRAVLFEENSHLERIESRCFYGCGFTEITIPKSVRFIGDEAFCKCCNLSKLSVAANSLPRHVGYRAFAETRLAPQQQHFIWTLEEKRPEEVEEEWEESDEDNT